MGKEIVLLMREHTLDGTSNILSLLHTYKDTETEFG